MSVTERAAVRARVLRGTAILDHAARTRRRLVTASATVVVAGIVCLTALLGTTATSNEAADENGPHAVQRAGHSVLWAAPRAATADTFHGSAVVSGTLTRTASGCLGLENAGEVEVLRFPYGSVLADDGESVEIPGHGVFSLGDTVHGGGVHLADEGADALDAPAECTGYRVASLNDAGTG
ncbi:hypothetical protein [Microbacterium gilvum]